MMDMCERAKLMEIVNQLVNTYRMDEFYCGKYTNTTFGWVRENNIQKTLGLCYESGASKGVFIIEDSDWVIKFNLVDEKRDYCGREYHNYLDAQRAGLAHYFAAVELLAEFEHITFYAQQKVDCDEEADSDIYDSLRQRYGDDADPDALWSEVEDMDDWDRMAYLFDNNDLCHFISEHHINDLHNGNIGLLNGVRIILDYSGFGESVWLEEE